MVVYAKATGRFGQIDTTTNGSLFRPTLNEEIISSGIDKIFISVPADYSPAYYKNIAHLYGKSLYGKCQIYTKMIGDGLSESKKAKFIRDFGEISDRVFVEHLAPCWPEYQVENVNQEEGIYGQPVTPAPEVCAYLFYSLKINSDGSVSTCFLDWSHKAILGDLNHESFKSIWSGEKLKAMRLAHLYGKRNELRMCCDCGQLTHCAPDSIDEFADEIAGRL
jgi:radical SAM protein with 4Fe4S-binding SPASM domain